MKKTVLFIMLLLISCFLNIREAIGATGVTSWEWINKGDYPVLKISYAVAPSASDVFTFSFSGTVLRVVVRGTSNDNNADLTFTDVSGAAYATFTDKLGSAVFDYVVYSTDQNSNVYGGCPVAGLNTMTLSDGAGLGVTTIYIYCKK